MATAKTNHLPDLALYVIRPALVEARLISEKRAHDAVYVATLSEELRTIEAKIAAQEQTLHLVSQQPETAASESDGQPSSDGHDAKWIRAKSSELDCRLRRIEHCGETELGLATSRTDPSSTASITAPRRARRE